MTLAEFARQIEISPATARQWKRRGRIVERDNSIGFELLGGPADVMQRYSALYDRTRDSMVGSQVGDGSGVRGTVVAVKPESVTVERDISVTAKWGPASRSNLIKVKAKPETGVTERDSGAARELAQDSRLCRREDSEPSLNPESRLESCAGCIALAERVAALESDISELREWVNNLQHGFQRRLRSLEGRPEPYHQSLPHSTRGAFDDGEGPMWGA